MKISDIHAIEILDSKGHPTVEVKVTLKDGSEAYGAVPSGASTGATEAHELRDGDESRFFGKGVIDAVSNVNTQIKDALIGQDSYDQAGIDQIMIDLDGTENKSNLGGNAIVGVSMAVCKAAAISQQKPLYKYFGEMYGNDVFTLPHPMILLMEGGKHGNWSTDVQEFMVRLNPEKFTSFKEILRVSAEIFHELGNLLKEKGYDSGVGYEGAYAPRQLKSNEEAFELMLEASSRLGYVPGEDITLAIDAAASEFYEDGHYIMRSEDNARLTEEQWYERVSGWMSKFPISSIEDMFDQESWKAWAKFTAEFGEETQIVGDDLVTTNVKRIQTAIDEKSMNSTLIKVNQIGTITETLAAIKLSEKAGFSNVISHRGGETNDDLIADLVVGTTAAQCKFGGPDRGERLAKYNRLLWIESSLLE